MEQQVFPDVSIIFEAKKKRRLELAKLPWEEKVAILETMRSSFPKGVWRKSVITETQSSKDIKVYQRYHLSHIDTTKIIETIRAELDKQDKGAAIAVVDSQGELLGFLRTDGCKLPSITIAINKAFTAAREQKPSKEIGNSSREQQWPMSNFGDPRYTAWGGGVPIFYQGQCVGGLGVSGLPEEEDMLLAAMGASLIA